MEEKVMYTIKVERRSNARDEELHGMKLFDSSTFCEGLYDNWDDAIEHAVDVFKRFHRDAEFRCLADENVQVNEDVLNDGVYALSTETLINGQVETSTDIVVEVYTLSSGDNFKKDHKQEMFSCNGLSITRQQFKRIGLDVSNLSDDDMYEIAKQTYLELRDDSKYGKDAYLRYVYSPLEMMKEDEEQYEAIDRSRWDKMKETAISLGAKIGWHDPIRDSQPLYSNE